MPFLQQGQDTTVVIPAGQFIRLGALQSAVCVATIPQGLPGSPIATVTDNQQVLGPYPAGATINVLAAKGYIEFVVGAAPVLTNQLYNPAAAAITGGSINNTPIGATTRSTLAATTIAATATDSTGTPGNVTNNSANGRAAFAATGSTVVVTNSSVAATDTVMVTLLGAADTTLTGIVGVTVAGGSFTVTGNAAATATKGFMFTVIKS